MMTRVINDLKLVDVFTTDHPLPGLGDLYVDLGDGRGYVHDGKRFTALAFNIDDDDGNADWLHKPGDAEKADPEPAPEPAPDSSTEP
jgi:hypothetical protein